jgi:cytochrome P450
MLTPFRRIQKQARQILGPTIQARLDAQYDNEADKPNDMIQILIDAAPDVERTMPQIAERLMTLNMASIHTTTMVWRDVPES